MFTDHEITDSSMLTKASYDAGSRQAIFTFKSNGAAYRFDGVTPDVFEKVIGAPSVGGAFNENIKGKYPSQKIG